MNEHSIKKLRRKFITLSFISLFSVMLIMGGTIFYVNYITTVRQMDNALNYLVEHGGEVDFDTPTRHWDGATYDSVSSSSENFATIFREILREAFNTKIDEGSESVFGMRYFAVVYKDEGDSNPITAHINEIDENSRRQPDRRPEKDRHDRAFAQSCRFGAQLSYHQDFLEPSDPSRDPQRRESEAVHHERQP